MSSNQQGFPYLGTPLVDSNGNVSIPWYRFFVSLWRNTGGSNVPGGSAVYFVENIAGGVDVYDTATASYIGTLVLSGRPGQPAVPQAPGASPFEYTALIQGTMVVTGAQVELSRDGATWYLVTLTGGAVPLKTGDSIRVTWYGDEIPKVTWFPD
jgi:hypothetical protein